MDLWDDAGAAMPVIGDRPSSYDVVIPCFDRAHVVADAVRSVLGQSHAATRIVVVDDGSNDDSADVIRRLAYEHRSVTPLLLPRNGGVAAARNAGIAACSAEWIVFLDSDDLLAPDGARLMLAGVDAAGLDVVVGAFARVGLGGEVGAAECGWDGGDIRAALRTGGVVGMGWSAVRRTAVYAAGGFDPSFRTCEDWDFFVQLAATGARFGRVRDLVAYYRTVAGERLIDDAPALIEGRRRVLAHPYFQD